jgi:methionyl-tRNA formyltransferase
MTNINENKINSILIFGDNFGIPQLIKNLPITIIKGIVVSSIRPEQHEELKKIAKINSIPFYIQPRRKDKDFLEFVNSIQNINPDLIFVNSYSLLIPEEILSIPKYGGINIHGALLPQYRGPNPIQWALLNNEPETGCTMHNMTKEFDAGDIIAQKKVPIYFEDTWLDIRGRVFKATEKMISEEIKNILELKNKRIPQKENIARHYPRRKPEDGLIEWSKSTLYIYNLIRALVKPYPGAFYLINDDKIIIDEYKYVSEILFLKYSIINTAHNKMYKKISVFPVKSINFDIKFNNTFILNESKFVCLKDITQNLDKTNELFVFCIKKYSEIIGEAILSNTNWANKNLFININLLKSDTILEDLKNSLEIIKQICFKELEMQKIFTLIPLISRNEIDVYINFGFHISENPTLTKYNKNEFILLSYKRA